MKSDSLPLLELRSVGKFFGQKKILHDISLKVTNGEIISLIGPSGSGKTTLLRCMNFLEPYDQGDIWIEGQLLGYSGVGRSIADRDGADMITQVRKPLAMVFQQFNLWPHMTVIENVMAPLVLGKRFPRVAAKQKALEALEQVGMLVKANNYPSTLSGGQQQRVGIARAIALAPRLLLLDEPTSALDPELVQEVLEVIQTLAQQGMAMVMVTHEMSFAAKISNQVVFMEAGKIIESGAPKIMFNKPKTARLEKFLAPWFKRPLDFNNA